jgi:hypothetical protein
MARWLAGSRNCLTTVEPTRVGRGRLADVTEDATLLDDELEELLHLLVIGDTEGTLPFLEQR